MIELTAEQLKALDGANGTPPVFVDHRTNESYVLVKVDEFAKVKPRSEPVSNAEIEIPEGIRRSSAAINRDLPALLASRKMRGRWVCYRGDERIGISKDYFELERECIRRGFEEDEYLIHRIEPGAGQIEFDLDRTLVELDEDEATNGS